MLKKRNRLSRNEFVTLLKQGRRIHSTTLTLVVRPADETKCGVVVGKKIARKAVARNRLRRLVYGVLGVQLPSLNNMHVAVLLRPQAATQSTEELRSELEGLLSRTDVSRAS